MRRFWSAVAAGILAAVWPPHARAQGEPLTLEDCVRLALASPSAATLAGQQREIARLGMTQARAAFLPQARVEGAFTYNSPLSGNRDVQSFVALNGIHEYGALLTAIEELDISGRLRAASARAHADRDAAEVGARIAERDLKRAVSGAYYRLLLARRLVQVTRDALEEAQRFEGRTQQLFSKGEAARADAVKAAAQTAFLEQTRNAAELAAQTANHELAAFWTDAVGDPLSLVDVLEAPVDPPTESGRQGDPYLRRPELDLLDAQRRGFSADAWRAHAERLPQANVAFQYGLDSLHFHGDDHGYATFVKLDVPVFDWFKAESASNQFHLQAEQAEIDRKIAERTFSREYQDALSRLGASQAQIALARTQVALSEENLRLSRVRYEGGEGSALEVLTAQGQLAEARTNYFTGLAQRLEDRAELAVAAGE